MKIEVLKSHNRHLFFHRRFTPKQTKNKCKPAARRCFECSCGPYRPSTAETLGSLRARRWMRLCFGDNGARSTALPEQRTTHTHTSCRCCHVRRNKTIGWARHTSVRQVCMGRFCSSFKTIRESRHSTAKKIANSPFTAKTTASGISQLQTGLWCQNRSQKRLDVGAGNLGFGFTELVCEASE